MGCVCCLQTPCVPLCRMPNEIYIDITLGSLLLTANWSITQAEINDIASEINGTYALAFQQSTASATDYEIVFGSPYVFPQNRITLFWFCYPSSWQFFYPASVGCEIGKCRSGSPFASRNIYTEPSIGTSVPPSTLPTIIDYCAGASFSASTTARLVAAPDTLCGAQPASSHRLAKFDLNLSYYL